jgi:hypothetical protein
MDDAPGSYTGLRGGHARRLPSQLGACAVVSVVLPAYVIIMAVSVLYSRQRRRYGWRRVVTKTGEVVNLLNFDAPPDCRFGRWLDRTGFRQLPHLVNALHGQVSMGDVIKGVKRGRRRQDLQDAYRGRAQGRASTGTAAVSLYADRRGCSRSPARARRTARRRTTSRAGPSDDDGGGGDGGPGEGPLGPATSYARIGTGTGVPS